MKSIVFTPAEHLNFNFPISPLNILKLTIKVTCNPNVTNLSHERCITEFGNYSATNLSMNSNILILDRDEIQE